MGFFVSKPKPAEVEQTPPETTTDDKDLEFKLKEQEQLEQKRLLDLEENERKIKDEEQEQQRQQADEDERKRRQREEQQRLLRMQQEDSLRSSRGGIETKTLLLEFDVNSVLFNRPEHLYKLRLTVESLNVDDYSKLLANANTEWPDFVHGNSVSSDVIKQRTLPVVAASEGRVLDQYPHVDQFRINKFQFVLPKGYCVNDVEHDVTLLVEVLCLPDDTQLQTLTEIVGCFRFAVFPRHNIPKINFNTAPGDYLFRLTDTVTLRRSEAGVGGVSVGGGLSYRDGMTGSINMHCGTMNFTAGLREVPHWTGMPQSRPTVSSPRSITPHKLSKSLDKQESTEFTDNRTADLPVSISPERSLDKSTQFVARNDSPPPHSEEGDHYVSELLRNRDVVQHQNNEISRLREQIQDLEQNNVDLRRGMNGYPRPPVRRPPLNQYHQDINALDGHRLHLEYNALASRLARQKSEVNDYREKVIRLQKELIQKNEAEKDYLQNGLDILPYSPDVALNRRVEDKEQKVLELEQLCKYQEKVIEKMEQLKDQERVVEKMERRIGTKTNEECENKSPNLDPRIENNGLRNTPTSVQYVEKSIDDESLQRHDPKYELLSIEPERADVRIRSLEKQISINARKWAHEKADLMLRLQESEYGLQRP